MEYYVLLLCAGSRTKLIVGENVVQLCGYVMVSFGIAEIVTGDLQNIDLKPVFILCVRGLIQTKCLNFKL